MEREKDQGAAPYIRELMRGAPEADIDAAIERFRQYVAIAVTVYERLVGDPEAYRRFREMADALTPPEPQPTMELKGHEEDATKK